jgi:hypothetical protein
MNEAREYNALRPVGTFDREAENDTPVEVGPILQSILGRRAERFGLAAVVLRGERIIAQGVAGVRKRGAGERIIGSPQGNEGVGSHICVHTFMARALSKFQIAVEVAEKSLGEIRQI